MQNVVVVGAGLIGASVAFHLARLGAQVTVLDPGAPADAATSNSFGWINASFAQTPAYFALRNAAVKDYAAFAATMPDIVDYQPTGSLWWEDAGAAFDAQMDELLARGYGARLVHAVEFAQLEPHVAGPPARCIYAPGEAAVDAVVLRDTLLKQAEQLGAKVKAGRSATTLGLSDGLTVKTNTGALPCDAVVLAAGIGCAPFLHSLGLHYPMDNVAGLTVQTKPVAPCVNRLVLSPDIHFRQMRDGRIVAGEIFSGNGPGAGRISTDPEGLAQDILARLKRRLPGVDGLEIEAVKVGVRPVPGDGLPAVGPVPGQAGLYLASMHSGVTLAPLVGRLLADEIVTGTCHSELADFRPDRLITRC
jgi:glycine/D-amino acid oxidase-like deaminating enzyme